MRAAAGSSASFCKTCGQKERRPSLQLKLPHPIQKISAGEKPPAALSRQAKGSPVDAGSELPPFQEESRKSHPNSGWLFWQFSGTKMRWYQQTETTGESYKLRRWGESKFLYLLSEVRCLKCAKRMLQSMESSRKNRSPASGSSCRLRNFWERRKSVHEQIGSDDSGTGTGRR